MRTPFLPSVRSALPALVVLLFVSFAGAAPARADDGAMDREAALIRRGFEIAPVPLDLKGKNRALVGLGSYIVNAVGDCNGCHSAGPAAEFARGGNPYFKGSPPTVVNQSTYLGGGRNFGALIPGTPEIVSRNLSPDRTGRPAGGLRFDDFLLILRTGTDLDHAHPNCASLTETHCFPATQPFNGDLLQVMPWPIYQNMSEREVRAIYEYLSAIPCVAGPPDGILHNECT